MRLKEYLNELAMKANTKIEPWNSGQAHGGARITLSNGEVFNFYISPGNVELQDGTKIDRFELMFTDSKSEINTSAKGKNTAVELFAALEKIVKEFIQTQKPSVIEFSPANKDEKSKQKLYVLLAKKIAKKFGYVIQDKDNNITKYFFSYRQTLINKKVYDDYTRQ
jgi:hypothetical protein